MRKLAYFSFSFSAGAALAVWELFKGRWLTGLIAVLSILILLSLFSKGRTEKAIRILALGLLCGLLWTGAYQHRIQSIPTEAEPFSAELTDYPEPSKYGCAVQAVTEYHGRRIRIRLLSEEFDADWKPGDVITGTGILQYYENDETGRYYHSIGVWMEATMTEITAVTTPEAIPVRYLPDVWAQSLRENIRQFYPSDVQGYLNALLTGDRSDLNYQEKSDLQMAGIYHTLAVSGMHVSILMAMLGFLTLQNRRLYPLIGIPTLVVYCLMVGCPASVIRAAVMQAFLILGALFNREADAPTSLGMALFCLTAQNPYCLTNVGLQLSFLATMGILLCSQRVYLSLHIETVGKLKRIAKYIRASLAQTCGALLLTTPIMAGYFGIVSVVSIVANLLMVSALTACFMLGFLSCALGYVIPIAAKVVAFPVTWLFRYVIWLTAKLARLSFAVIYPQSPYLVFWLIFVYALVLLLYFRKLDKQGRRISACCATITLCLCLLLSWADRQGEHFTFKAIDVGQGQSLYLESKGYTAAIDCGGSYGDEAGELLARELLAGGHTRLNYLVVTHFDDDHTGGIRQLLHRVPVDVMLVSDLDWENTERIEVLRLAMEHGTEIQLIAEDTVIPFGAGNMQIFAPVSEKGGNASCLSTLATFGDYDILVTGDLAISQERILLETHSLPDVELLVAGHHGSSSSTGQELLVLTSPEIVVISVGENGYGHPADEVLHRITSVGATALRTDELGTITVRR